MARDNPHEAANAALVLRYYMENTTVRDLQAFLQSETFDDLVWRSQGRKLKCEAYQRLLQREDLKASEAWAVALSMGMVLAADEAQKVGFDGDLEPSARKTAERLLMEVGISPPHFTHVVRCENCIAVTSPTPSNEILKFCPWCETGYGAFIRKMRDE